MSLFAAAPLTDMTEKAWELQLVGTKDHPGLVRQVGFRVYHTLRSKGSQPGWPDWACVRERLVLLELKTEKSKPTEPQKTWIRELLGAGVEIYLARPRHLDLLAPILASRGDPFDRRGEVREAAAELRHLTQLEVAP